MWNPPVGGGFRAGGDRNDLFVGVGNASGLQPFQGPLSVLESLGRGEGFGGDHDQSVVRVHARQGMFQRMAVDIGQKAYVAPAVAIAKGRQGQAHAPVAATNTNMDYVAPAALGVGDAHEFVHTLAFLGNFRRGGGGAQGAVPGGALFGAVDDAAV